VTVVGAGVPEAPVNVDSDLGWSEHNIGPPPQPWQRRHIDPVAQPLAVQRAPDRLLGRRVAGPLHLHPAADAWATGRRPRGAVVAGCAGAQRRPACTGSVCAAHRAASAGQNPAQLLSMPSLRRPIVARQYSGLGTDWSEAAERSVLVCASEEKSGDIGQAYRACPLGQASGEDRRHAELKPRRGEARAGPHWRPGVARMGTAPTTRPGQPAPRGKSNSASMNQHLL
jgi:hypothetical protein